MRALRILAVLGAALCFSTTGTAQALAGAEASPVAIGAARILIGGGILGLVGLAFRLRARGARGGAAVVRTGSARSTAAIIAVGALGVLAYQPTFFLGTRMNGVAIGTVVALGSAPIATGVLDALVRRRIPGRRWMLATGIAIVGVVLVSGLVGTGGAGGAGGSADGAGAVHPLGILASLGAGFSYALYAVAAKALLDRGWGAPDSMGALFGVASALSLPLVLVGAGWLARPEGVALALWLGIVTTAIAYLLFGWGLQRLAAPTVSTLTLAEPLSATLLGLIVLHERLDALAVIGLIVIAAALVVLSLPARASAVRDTISP